ncbi:tRNA (adenosine(37)-N6)-dimethylallyltransferase MiaA [Candidatus Peregrinibacteria bacterium]|jgi:tRNA dimethylallyltransferase|nr:tRNA (adenosine(37)-N6)-dimethylallyltransferase MiaA [Candidatus Peregrinibacteria bacterium]
MKKNPSKNPLQEQLKKFLKTTKTPLIVLLGPTASGKTSLSLKIAKEINGEIISTDSRQIYKGLEIGSDILAPEDQEGIPHHMMAISTPDKEISLAEYKDLAIAQIEEIYKRKHVPMLVGGTGLYISSIIEGYDVPKVPADKAFRAKIQEEADEQGTLYIHKRLAKIDPEAAKKIHPNNLRYVIRALEINLKTGKNKADQKSSTATTPPFDTFMIGIDWPREELYDRVDQRVEIQLKRGLVEEAKKLLEQNYDEELPAMSSLGAKEFFPFLSGEATLEECVAQLKQNTRNYAKRQMTWFRKYKDVHWLNP